VSGAPPGQPTGPSGRSLAALACLVVARLAFHALYLPAFEGPDEPQHLARALDYARRPWRAAFAGARVDGDVVAAVVGHPCPRREVGCPSYSDVPGAFDLLRPPVRLPGAAWPIPNEEAKQPPLYYATAGLVLRALGAAGNPTRALLALRLFDVLLAAAAIFFPLRRLLRGSPRLAAGGLLLLLTPGAAEALARCSNDASVFLWSSVVLDSLDRDARPRMRRLLPLLAAGPLLKLTAVPVVVFAVVALWRERSRALAAAGALASLSVFPVQALRGWAASGALELQRGTPGVRESLGGWIAGLARTAWTMAKTATWAVGWSLLRPPLALAAACVAFPVAAVSVSRPRSAPRRAAAHAAAAAALAAGTLVFAIATRRYFGVWGGVTGWYVWSWTAWIFVAARDLLEVDHRRGVVLLFVEAALVVALNAAWVARASAAYGG
jgi:hypothetical protein